MHRCVRGVCVATLLLLLLAHTAAAQYLFNRADLPVGNEAASLAVGDFNGDGAPDLAVGHADSTISVFLSDHHGGFAAKVDTYAAFFSESLVAGDFNGDGKLDLLVPFEVILLGNGDGTFRVQNLPYNPKGFAAAADFNGDGKLDVVAGDIYSNTVSIWLGNGDGTFKDGIPYATSNKPEAIAIGDFNGDGKLDLAVTDTGLSDTISILLGNGDGTFRTTANYPAARVSTTIAAADLNGDGFVDLIVGSSDLQKPQASILWGHGDGTFDAPTRYDLMALQGPLLFSISVGDLNGDGWPDLIASLTPGVASVFLNTGHGGFQARADYRTGPDCGAISLADFNGDGHLDLSCVHYTQVTVLFGAGDGTFATPIASTSASPNSMAAGDFNGDGRPDLATTNLAGPPISILLGNGNGTFQPDTGYDAGLNPTAVTLADLNHDGRLDLAVANMLSNSITVYLGNGDGTLRQRIDYATDVNPDYMTVADFNSDGNVDLAVTNWPGDTLAVFLGNGDGTFQPPLNSGISNQSGPLLSSDFNGDGKADIAVATYCGWYPCGTSQVSILPGTGNGRFGQKLDYAVGISPTAIVAGDFNRDGKLDVVTANATFETVTLLLGNGDGTFRPYADYYTGLDRGVGFIRWSQPILTATASLILP